MKIKKGDNVIVMTGRDKGKTGVVSKVMSQEDQIVIDGVNVRTKNVKRPGAKGQQVTSELPIHVSNVMIYDAKAKKGTRTGTNVVDGKKVRVSKRTGNQI